MYFNTIYHHYQVRNCFSNIVGRINNLNTLVQNKYKECKNDCSDELKQIYNEALKYTTKYIKDCITYHLVPEDDDY